MISVCECISNAEQQHKPVRLTLASSPFTMTFVPHTLAQQLNFHGEQDLNVTTAVGLGASAEAAIERGHVDAAVLTGSAITVLQRRFPKLTVLADTRTAEGVRMLLGNDVYPAYGLLATADWLQKNPTTARDVASAVNKATAWMREHSPKEIRARMPARYRSADAEADLEALRAAIPMLSSDGTISTHSAETVRQALALSVDKVRTLPIDLSQTYANESIRAR